MPLNSPLKKMWGYVIMITVEEKYTTCTNNMAHNMSLYLCGDVFSWNN